MRKTRDLFKKTGDIKETFCARMDMKKNRNSKYLRESGKMNKKCQEYTEELYNKALMTQLIMMVWSLI